MISFWIVAALLSALVASFVVQRAARAAASPAADEDPSLGVYRRQLTEIDELADRGLLPSDELKLARAEAGRRLLRAAETSVSPATAAAGDRKVVLAVAALAPLAAVGLYLLVGAPGAPDQPYLKRLAAWRQANPAALDAPRMAAVLGAIVAEHPGNPEPLYYLSHAQAAAGEPFLAERSLKQAVALAPGRVDLWTELGELLSALASGKPSPEARAAFERALALDPHAPSPRYNLALEQIESGDISGGLAGWRALAADLPADDAQRPALLGQIAQVERTGAAPTSATGAAASPASSQAPPGQQAFIQAMVDRLAARLTAQPDDPAGWGRLIRAYAVLGDTTRREAAEARAQSLFKTRPDALRAIRSAAGSSQ